MSQGTPNLRVGLEVQIFGRNQMRQAQAALSALGLTIEDVQDALVDVNGTQTRYYRGVVRLTGATNQNRQAQAQLARQAINNATANARVAARITNTASAASQATRAIRALQRQQQAAARAAQQLANHQARVNTTLNARIAAQNNQAQLAAQNIALRNNNAVQMQGLRQVAAANAQQHQINLANVRYQNQVQLQNLRHQQAMQRQQNYGGGGGIMGGFGVFGNVGRVIAYDMLRRTITNLYQGFWRINETLADWVIQSVQFNDEMDRAKTVFQGLGMIGTKNADGTSMTIPQAELSTDPKVRAVLAQSEKNADSMIRGLMEISAITGSDMDEVISSARQLLPDLINKRAKAGMPNPYLEKPEELNAITQQMVKLASVLKMSDPGGRPLKWHMTAIQELFSGTSGGSKDKGKEAVRSLRAREGIKMTDEEASNLAKAVNSGDLMKASEMITNTLERAGQGLQNLDNLMAKTLKPNVDGVITALRIFSMDFSDIFHKDLIAFFTTVRVGIFKILNLDSYKKTMGRLSNLFSEQFGDIQGNIYEYLQKIYDDPAILYTKLEGPIRNLGIGLRSVRIGIEAIWNFIQGVFGQSLGFENLETTMTAVRDNAYSLGVSFNYISNSMFRAISDMPIIIDTFMRFGTAIAIVATVIEIGIRTIFETISGITAYYIRAMNSNPFTRAILRLGGLGPLGTPEWEQWATNRTQEIGQDPLSAFSGTLGAIDRLNEFLELNNRIGQQQNPQVQQNMAVAMPMAYNQNIAVPTNSGYTQPAVQNNPIATRAITPNTRPTASGTINASINDQAVVEGFRVARPIQVNPRALNQAVNVNIGTLNLSTDNAQQFVDNLVQLGRGAPQGGRRLVGPYSNEFLDAASARGFQY